MFNLPWRLIWISCAPVNAKCENGKFVPTFRVVVDVHTVCPRSSYQIYIVTYYKNGELLLGIYLEDAQWQLPVLQFITV